jgi:hypothetical protein
LDLDDARRVFRDRPVGHLATVGPEGPHAVPLWFVWDERAVYVSVRGRSRTLSNVRTDPRVALVIDSGREWTDLAGVVLHGDATPLRADHPDLRGPISRWFEKYRGFLAGQGFRRFSQDVEELWFLRFIPDCFSSWDHATPNELPD